MAPRLYVPELPECQRTENEPCISSECGVQTKAYRPDPRRTLTVFVPTKSTPVNEAATTDETTTDETITEETTTEETTTTDDDRESGRGRGRGRGRSGDN